MTPLIERLSSDFLPLVLTGMLVNFKIAALALIFGLFLGLLLVFARLNAGKAVSVVAGSVIALMRAAPTFVVMFFLLNAIPRDASVFGFPFALSGVMTVVISLIPYTAAYIADSGVEGVQHLRSGSNLGALLFLPNVTRAFFVLVMSSSAGAAIGVAEGISAILRQAEMLPALSDRLILFAIGILLFGIPLQAGFAMMRIFQRRLSRRMTRAFQAGSSK